MQSAVLSIQPTGTGDEISWWHFHRGTFYPARYLEKKLGFTVQLTDAITTLISISESMDPECSVTVTSRKGFFFPDFILRIESSCFSITAEKAFAGGSRRENVFNYTVAVVISTEKSAIIEKMLKEYRSLGPGPLRVVINGQ